MMARPVVVYQGVPGAYSEAAANELLGSHAETVGLDTFEKCFVALDEGNADFAMLPMENSMGGTVHDCFDLQVRFDLNIVAELDFRVRHCLLALKGVKKEDLKKVISHPQALAQCEKYLKANGILAQKEFDTAGSAEKVAKDLFADTGAIASELAGETYGLSILERNIEDDPNNVTRFFLFSKNCLIPPKAHRLMKDLESNISYKTTLVLSFANSPGALCRALTFFANSGIDLTKLESRPNKYQKSGRFLPPTLPAEILDLFANITFFPTNAPELETQSSALEGNPTYPFIFYLDILGSISEHRVIYALKQVASFCVYFRVLGSFPRGGVLQQFVAQAVKVPNNSVLSKESDTTSLMSSHHPKKKIKIAIVGFGNFGQFLAKTLLNHFEIVVCNRSDTSIAAANFGLRYYTSPSDLLTTEKDVSAVVLCVSILAFEKVLHSIAPDLLSGLLLIDVLSVKEFPKRVLTELKERSGLDLDILCTHPMFGPESGKHSWKNLPMVFEKILPYTETRANVCEEFLNAFEREGCRLVEMSCEEHDLIAADSQFITHYLGRSIKEVGFHQSNDEKREISTTGFKSLLNIRDQTVKDSFDLFSALYIFNDNAKSTVKKFQGAMSKLLEQLEQKKKATTQEKLDLSGFQPSNFLSRIETSKTAETFRVATQLIAEGKDVLMSLCVGEPDFSPPKEVLKATKKAVDDGFTKYTTVQGILELRKEICISFEREKQIQFKPEEILITPSGKQALLIAILALIEPGDEVIIPAPYWTSYPDLVRFAGGTPVILPTRPEDDYIFSSEDLEKCITSQTKMLIFNNPSNPTGTVLSGERVRSLAKVLLKPENSKVVVLSDEIYDKLVYDNTEVLSFAQIEALRERVVIVNGFSKAYAMTGYRLGYLAAKGEVARWGVKIQSQINSCASSISQRAGISALRVDRLVLLPLYEGLRRKRDLVCEGLKQIPGVKVPRVLGAFYAFPDVSSYIGPNVKDPTTGSAILSSTELCEYLLRSSGVALVPGDAFGAPYGMRLSFACSEDDIKEAIRRISQGFSRLERF